MWIWEQADWPRWRYDMGVMASPLDEAARAIGRLHGRLAALQTDDRERAAFAALSADVLESSAIEGEFLDVEAVRSSLARRLGVPYAGAARMDRHVEGVVEMTLDATRHAEAPLTAARLQAWQAALFPTGRSGLSEIRIGQWRNDTHGSMQVVSGPIGRQRVHFEVPPADRLADEMATFLAWSEAPGREPALLKAGLAHL